MSTSQNSTQTIDDYFRTFLDSVTFTTPQESSFSMDLSLRCLFSAGPVITPSQAIIRTADRPILEEVRELIQDISDNPNNSPEDIAELRTMIDVIDKHESI